MIPTRRLARLARDRRGLRADGRALDVRDDRHFYATPGEFAAHAHGRKQLRLEYFYRELRRRHGVLMDGDEPVGGRWSFDTENRSAFGKSGPPAVPSPPAAAPDAVTREVLALVERRFAGHPGRLDHFDWPVTRDQALAALAAFIEERLPDFGRFQDAMWAGEPWLYHSRLSAALNLKLLHPRDVVSAAEAAYRAHRAPIASVEGFVRQILGGASTVRGIYWMQMPPTCRAMPGGPRSRCRRSTGRETPHGVHCGTPSRRPRIRLRAHIHRSCHGPVRVCFGVEPAQAHHGTWRCTSTRIEWVELAEHAGDDHTRRRGSMPAPYAPGQLHPAD